MLKTLYSFGITIAILLFACSINTQAQAQEQKPSIINEPPANQETDKASAKDNNAQIVVIAKPQEKTNPTSQQNYNNEDCFSERFLKFSITDLLLAIFTGLLVAVTIWQYRVSKKTRRAFVFLKDIDLIEIRGRGYTSMPSNDQITWLFFPRWANSGDTPTRNLTVSIGCKITSQGLPENFNYLYINKELSNDDGLPYVIPIKDISMMVGPKAEILSEPLILGTLINVTGSIIEGIMDIYIWGQAEYNDIFKRTPRHITRFCVKLLFTKEIGQKAVMSIASYGKYNCADKDCNEQP